MEKKDLGNGWFAEVGQEYPVEVWAFSVFHDDNDPDYDGGWWSDRVRLRGFTSAEQAERALGLYLRHEALLHCEVYARGWDDEHEVVELVQVFYRFDTKRWSYRLSFTPNEASGWASYFSDDYGSPVDAIKAGQAQWEQLRKLGTGGSGVNPEFVKGDDFYG